MRDEDFGELFDQLLVRYRFTPREETETWHEAAIDPEILGRAFESLMESPERRATGAFYTPVTIVSRVSTAALEATLAGHGIAEGALERLSRDVCDERERTLVRGVLTDIRVIDPACGSGAFLVHMLDRLATLRAQAGDARVPSVIRRDVLARSIFGVDLNPTAVWLCELRLWLSLVMDHDGEDITAVPPLPNLDHNIRCGDTLLGGDFSLAKPGAGGSATAMLRARYARATGPRKRSLGRMLDRLERGHLVAWIDARLAQVSAHRRSLVGAARGRDLFGGRRGTLAAEREQARQLRLIARDLRARRRNVVAGSALPFAFAAQFPDAAHAGGFDIVLGNPPWIRLHHIPAAMREGLRREFQVFREAAWVDGARTSRAGSGFGSQVDAASLFIERGHYLLRDGGVLSLLVPSKLWRSLAGGGVRRLLTERASLQLVEDWSAAPSMFDAATYPSIVVATRGAPAFEDNVRLSVHHGRAQVEWRAPRSHLPLDDTAGSPWLSLPPDARAAFDRLCRAGVPLTASGLGLTTLGVKCGCNEAFLVTASATAGGVDVTDGVRRALLEPRYVRRVLRGEMVSRWTARPRADCIVFPHGDDGDALERLPAGVREWLWPWRARLEARTDARGGRPWWSLFRLEGSRCDRPRVVWADLGKSLDALVLEAGDRTVPLNTCYVLRAKDLVDAHA
ncbi:MAG TPA: DNA methyltransferase, partial [Thermoanaerobaculia bacterium]|nr:DNA methyltransferase [Thermoanaerobaculia bacterium]